MFVLTEQRGGWVSRRIDKSLDHQVNHPGLMALPLESTSPLAAPRTWGLRERLAGLAGLVTTPLVPSDYLDRVVPLRAGTALRGRIVGLHPETPDAVSVVIRPGRDWAGHVPGQYVRIGVDVDGVRQWRTYSLSSDSRRTDGCIAITVKAVDGGVVSGYLVRRARVGTVVQLDQAMGEFTLPAVRPTKVLLVAAGSGITPVMGMLRSNRFSDVVVVHSARTAADAVFGGELRAMAARGEITLVERHTSVEGRIDAAELERLVPDLAARRTWACGPGEMLDALESHFATRGISERLRTERFRPVVAVPTESGSSAVTFSRTGTVVEASTSTSLLDAGEDAGVLMPSGCRMGICFGCVVPLREGMVRDLRDGALTTAAPGDGVLIQTCVSAAAGACDIDL
jgi:ferredoxin-NADP reductase